MWRLLSAVRASTKAARSGREYSSHSSSAQSLTSTLASSSSTTAASAVATHSKSHARSFCHDLSFCSFTPSLASRHHERRACELAIKISGQNLVHPAASKADHLHTGGGQSSLRRCGDRAADESPSSKAQELGYPARRIRRSQAALLAAYLAAVLHVDQQEIDRDIEYGRDTALPVWNRNSHHKGIGHLVRQSSKLLWKRMVAAGSAPRSRAMLPDCRQYLSCNTATVYFTLSL